MDDLIKIAQEYGVLGIILLGTFWYILYKDRAHTISLAQKDETHKEERNQLFKALEDQHNRSLEVTKNNTNVLSEISTLIKNQKHMG